MHIAHDCCGQITHTDELKSVTANNNKLLSSSDAVQKLVDPPNIEFNIENGDQEKLLAFNHNITNSLGRRCFETVSLSEITSSKENV